jgi:imidazolonepropionase-like amidohydrolase
MGTDIGGQDLLPHGRNAEALTLSAAAGMPTGDVIVAGILDAARCSGAQSPGHHTQLWGLRTTGKLHPDTALASGHR